jgi:hypothetical protein
MRIRDSATEGTEASELSLAVLQRVLRGLCGRSQRISAFGYNDRVNEIPANRPNVMLRAGALLALVAALAAVVFWLRGGAGDAMALNPNDSMASWRSASSGQKRATAEMLVVELRRDGTLGPVNRAVLDGPGGLGTFVEGLVAALDAATDRNRAEYVSPGEPIARTATGAAFKMGWNK